MSRMYHPFVLGLEFFNFLTVKLDISNKMAVRRQKKKLDMSEDLSCVPVFS